MMVDGCLLNYTYTASFPLTESIRLTNTESETRKGKFTDGLMVFVSLPFYITLNGYLIMFMTSSVDDI